MYTTAWKEAKNKGNKQFVPNFYKTSHDHVSLKANYNRQQRNRYFRKWAVWQQYNWCCHRWKTVSEQTHSSTTDISGIEQSYHILTDVVVTGKLDSSASDISVSEQLDTITTDVILSGQSGCITSCNIAAQPIFLELSSHTTFQPMLLSLEN